MSRRRRSPWYVGCQWAVITPTTIESRPGRDAPGGRMAYEEIYCARTRSKAKSDAKSWQERTGKPAFIIPGSGHKSRRDIPGHGHRSVEQPGSIEHRPLRGRGRR